MKGGSCCGNIARTMVRGCTGSLRWGIQSRAGAAMLIGVSLSSNAVSGSSTGERIDTKEITSIPTTTTVKRREPIRRHNSMGTNYASLASSVNATRLEWWDLVCVQSLCSILARITAFPEPSRRLPSAYLDRGRLSFLSEKEFQDHSPEINCRLPSFGLHPEDSSLYSRAGANSIVCCGHACVSSKPPLQP